MKGNLRWIGDFAECRKVSEQDWKGNYCYVTFDLPTLAPVVSYSKKMYRSSQLKIIKIQFNKPIQYGICVPNVCTNKDIAAFITYGKLIILMILKHEIMTCHVTIILFSSI